MFRHSSEKFDDKFSTCNTFDRIFNILEEITVSIERFKLAVLDLDEFSDLEIEKLFLNLEVNSENDIREAIGILQVHRPQVIEHLTLRYPYLKTIQ